MIATTTDLVWCVEGAIQQTMAERRMSLPIAADILSVVGDGTSLA
jgi:hypothetical protein